MTDVLSPTYHQFTGKTYQGKFLEINRSTFPSGIQDVLSKAELADNGMVRGTMVIRPYGYAIWERMQSDIDGLIKAAGAENVYLPLLIPQSYLHREAEHVESFSPEIAVVTHAGGKQLDEPVVVRPTSETLFGEFMAIWVQSYRDLPLLLNQWANVVRWELRPRIFLRTTEFLWQEGHTAHATQEEATGYALRILLDVYRQFFVDILALPVLIGNKTARERFAGAVNTLTCEGMMRDGKAMQMATSRELGQTFSKVFDVAYTDASGGRQLAWTTSRGSSTRMVGAMIMAHGDDDGLRIPPRIAPIQAAVIVVRDDPDSMSKARALRDELVDSGIRATLDDQIDVSFGRRATGWTLKGVPVRIEIGPRELVEGQVAVVRRDTNEKQLVEFGAMPVLTTGLLEEIQHSMREDASARLESNTEDANTLEEAVEIVAKSRFARLPLQALDCGGEAKLARESITVRYVRRVDGTVPHGIRERSLRNCCQVLLTKCFWPSGRGTGCD